MQKSAAWVVTRWQETLSQPHHLSVELPPNKSAWETPFSFKVIMFFLKKSKKCKNTAGLGQILPSCILASDRGPGKGTLLRAPQR